MKRTPEMDRSIKKCLELDMPITKLCMACGITEPTFYNWVKWDPDFAAMVRTAKFFVSNAARASVIKHMKHDGGLALKYLERKEKDEFSTKSIVKGEAPSSRLDEEEKEALKKIFKENDISVPDFDEDGGFEDEMG